MRQQIARLTLLGMLGVVAIALAADDATKSEPDRQTTASGLTIVRVSPGDGAARAGDTVYVHYTGRLENGKEFDSSRGRSPIDFQLGAGRVIKGWEEGIAGMQVGEKRQLIIPPGLAYGDRGAGDGVIPPGATLHFDVELVGIVRK